MRSNGPPQLLISVRHAAEARAALAGGCDVIDVKEPARGARGRADAKTIEAIVRAVGHAAPISAALGELHDNSAHPSNAIGDPAGATPWQKLSYLKLGLAQAPRDWRSQLAGYVSRLGAGRFVAVAYADHERAQAPAIDAIVQWAIDQRVAGVLLDTYIKDGRTLFDWCDRDELTRFIARAHYAGLFVALAGSLSLAAVARAAPLGPDLIAVRGAACAHDQRAFAIHAPRVRALRQQLIPSMAD